MTYKEGDVLSPQCMGDCPFCEDGEIETDTCHNDYHNYTYYCGNCEGELDIQIIHTVTAVRPPKAK